MEAHLFIDAIQVHYGCTSEMLSQRMPLIIVSSFEDEKAKLKNTAYNGISVDASYNVSILANFVLVDIPTYLYNLYHVYQIEPPIADNSVISESPRAFITFFW